MLYSVGKSYSDKLTLHASQRYRVAGASTVVGSDDDGVDSGVVQ